MKRIVIFGALLAMGCTRSGLEVPETENGGLVLTTTGVDWSGYVASGAGLVKEPVSVGKATESRFQPKDEMGIFLYSGQLTYQSSNMRYFTQEGSPDGVTSPQWLAGDAMGGRMAAGTTYYGVGYYPYKVGVTDASAVPHTVALDQSAQEGAEATALERSDFLWAAPVEVQTPTHAPTVGLSFRHGGVKMVINLDVPMVIDGYAVVKAKGVTIKNLYTSCTFDLRTGVAGNFGDRADIRPRLVSGDLLPGRRTLWEAVVLPQELDVNFALIEFLCETSAGDKTVRYMPPGAGLTLAGGTKVTFLLTSSADLAITSELDLFTGEAETLPLKVKTTSGTGWTLTSSQPTWLTLSTSSTGTFGTSITGTGTGVDQTVYVRTVANTGSGAISRDAVLTLSAVLSGVSRSVSYRAVQNYSVPVTGFPEKYVWMAGCQYELPKVKGNSKWYIKAASLPSTVKFSTRNVAWSDLQSEDLVDVVSGKGFEVLGNYFNTGGSLYVVTDPTASPKFDVLCNGVNVTIDARTALIGNLRWARGHLVATGAPGAAGLGGCKIGGPGDAGVNFQFGSLIGWKNGAFSNGGNGVGIAPVDWHGRFWGGAIATQWPGFTTEAYVWPTEIGGDIIKITNWPSLSDHKLNWFFDYYLPPWDQSGRSISGFDVPFTGDKGGGTLSTGRYAKFGVGDPCAYYLGGGWRMPTQEEYNALLGNVPAGTAYSVSATPNVWWGDVNLGVGAGALVGFGVWDSQDYVNKVFFCRAGQRSAKSTYTRTGIYTMILCSTIVSPTPQVCYIYLSSSGINPAGVWNTDRGIATPARCVKEE